MKRFLSLLSMSLATILASYDTTVFAYDKKCYTLAIKENSNKALDVQAIIFLTVTLIIISIVAVKIIKKRLFEKAYSDYRKSYDLFDEQYYREKPSDLNATLALYLAYTNITDTNIATTLFDLVDKGVLGCSLGNDAEDRKSFKFKINNNLNYEVLGYENFLINWFRSYGSEDCFSIYDIEKATESMEGAKSFYENYNKWSDLLRQEGEKYIKYFTIRNRKVIDNETYNEKLKWRAFESYFIDLMEENLNINLCKKYLPYMVSFDIAEEFADVDERLGKDYSLLKGIGIITIAIQDIYYDMYLKIRNGKI